MTLRGSHQEVAYGPAWALRPRLSFPTMERKKGEKAGSSHHCCTSAAGLTSAPGFNPSNHSLPQPSANPGPPRGDHYTLWNKLDKNFHPGSEGSRKQSEPMGFGEHDHDSDGQTACKELQKCLSPTVLLMPRHPPNGHFSLLSGQGTRRSQPEEMTAPGTAQVSGQELERP